MKKQKLCANCKHFKLLRTSPSIAGGQCRYWDTKKNFIPDDNGFYPTVIIVRDIDLSRIKEINDYTTVNGKHYEDCARFAEIEVV